MGVKRVFLIVLDSLGVGMLEDAYLYGDGGANTLLSLYKTGMLDIPNLKSLGIGDIEGVEYLKADSRTAAVGRLREMSAGKDTTTGHWEIAGILTREPMPTFPDGFPADMLDEYERRIGRGVLCGLPYSGTAVIDEYGQEHIRTGRPIVYTSADSVFQIAAHEDIISRETLYEYCRIAREMLVGKWGVGRVIARPFIGESGSFKRTDGRRDFSLVPPSENMLTSLKDAGLDVISVGKIKDIFAGVGVTESIPTHSNADGIEVFLKLLGRDFSGLCFINLVDFDMKYGHRQDAVGYAMALNEFDACLTEALPRLCEDDVLIITADHGCDPSDDSTDHTREHTPLIIYGDKILPKALGTGESFANIGKTVCSLLETTPNFTLGEDLTPKILK